MPTIYVIRWYGGQPRSRTVGYSFHTSLADIPTWPYIACNPFEAPCTDLAWAYVESHPAKSVGLRALSAVRPLCLFDVISYRDHEPDEIAGIEDRTAREVALSEYLRHSFRGDDPVVVTPNEMRDARAALRVR